MAAFLIDVQVRFRDIDALGHVNNAVFLSYCELARQSYFQRDFGVADANAFQFILARAELDYLIPLAMSDRPVRLSLTVPRIGTSSWDFSYEIGGGDSGPLFCRARTVQVCYDYARGASRPIPEDWRTKLKARSE